MKVLYVLLCFMAFLRGHGQDSNLAYFLALASANDPALKENVNLRQIGLIQEELLKAQNTAYKVDASSELLVAPYFNNYGNVVAITANPDPKAYGYDVSVTNGGLYAAQLNISRNLFNQRSLENLLFRNRLSNESLSLTSEEISHLLQKNVIDAYILAYQWQLQEDFTSGLINDLDKRLEVVSLLVKRGILMESDFLLLQLEKENRVLELKQIQSAYTAAYTRLYNLAGTDQKTFERLDAPLLALSNRTATYFVQKRFMNDSTALIADREVFENQYRPQISAYGNTGLNAVELNNIYHRFGLSAGLRVTVPIYDGKQKKLNAQQTRFRSENLQLYRDNARLQLDNTVEDIGRQIASQEQNLKLIEGQLVKQQQILEIFKGKLVKGQVSVIDYLNVLQNYKLTAYTQLQTQVNLWLLYNQYNYTNW